MKINNFLCAIFLWLTLDVLTASVLPGTLFTSPNGRYSVELTENKSDKLLHFVIKDVQTGDVSNRIVMPTALLYLHWSASSTAFVTVEHLAHGSYGRIISFKGGTWRTVEIRPPDTARSDVKITNLEILNNDVHVRFAVRDLNEDNVPIRHRVCDIDVSLSSGQFSNVKCIPVSATLGAAIARERPSYQPPMTGRTLGR